MVRKYKYVEIPIWFTSANEDFNIKVSVCSIKPQQGQIKFSLFLSESKYSLSWWEYGFDAF